MKRLGLFPSFTSLTQLSLAGALALAACASPDTKDALTPPPAITDPNIVVLEAAQGSDYLLANSAQEVIARVRVDTRSVARAKRPKLNLALAIDTSGSMAGPAIANARAAAIALVDELHDGDQLSVIAFSSSAKVLLPLTQVSKDNRAELKRAIGAMQARGTTAMTAGLANALQQASRGRIAGGVNRIVLLSDGVPNDETSLRALADRANQAEIAITALGLGLDYNETLLADLAQRSGGTFHYVEESTQVAQVFEKEIMRLEQIVARNLRLQFTPGPGVAVKQVIGYEAPRNGRSVHVGLGNLSAGEHLDVFVRLDVGGHRNGAAVELLDVLLTFQDAVVNAGSLKRDLFISARATDDAATVESGAHTEILREALRADLADVIVRAIASARAGNLQAAEQLLIVNESRAREAARTYADKSFAIQADEMVELKTSLPSIVPARPTSPGSGGIDRSAISESAPATVRRSHSKALRTIKRRN